MQYNALKSIVPSHKIPVALQIASDSFFVKSTRIAPYIEPRFSKIEFPTEKPSILLVSAVGASGKTTTAHALSFDTQLPILDLAKHRAVGGNSLTGILTTAYPIDKVGAVLEGLRTGTHGIIIDGIDEGRSKTTEQGFEAFLDDLIERSQGSPRTTIVVFGRSQVLLSTWCYLADKAADVGLVQIEPFDIEQAREYIDSHAMEGNSNRQEIYNQTRDSVLTKLSAAFSSTTADEAKKNTFLSFIGYPPVLHAIATLLQKERNYHRLQQALSDKTGDQLEIDLLIRISDYLLDRDHEEKALPNFIADIVDEAGGSPGQRQALRRQLFDGEEQCARVLARALARPFPRQVLEDNVLNEKYENAVATWCPDHPFLDDTRVRNVVFAAVAVAHCALSSVEEYRALAYDYASANLPTYHLLYIMAELAKAREISVRSFNMLIQSCSEFLGVNAEISIDIDGDSWEESEEEHDTKADLTIAVKFPDRNQERSFVFSGPVGVEAVQFGPYLINTSVTLPCAVDLLGSPAIEVIGDCRISARSVRIETPDLILRNIPRRTHVGIQGAAKLFINTHRAEGRANEVSCWGGETKIQCVEPGLEYPLGKYVQIIPEPFTDPEMREKYRRVRRILSEFRSNKNGGLAKLRAKIEHERVLQNPLGKRILAALLKEDILSRNEKFVIAHAISEMYVSF